MRKITRKRTTYTKCFSLARTLFALQICPRFSLRLRYTTTHLVHAILCSLHSLHPSISPPLPKERRQADFLFYTNNLHSVVVSQLWFCREILELRISQTTPGLRQGCKICQPLSTASRRCPRFPGTKENGKTKMSSCRK